MSRICYHCRNEETDDAFFCSRCRGRLDSKSVFNGATPKMYDEHTPEKPYIVWIFPFAFLETIIVTKDQFLARTILVAIWLGFLFLILGFIAGSIAAALLFTIPLALLWYLMWRYGRKEAKTGYW